ncbi:MAG TPA: hypothetical protein VMB52_06570 [Verrucomicrobiae bacterium]|nr:hypothetical protein [Verrucomicrobiae bacterium]
MIFGSQSGASQPSTTTAAPGSDVSQSPSTAATTPIYGAQTQPSGIGSPQDYSSFQAQSQPTSQPGVNPLDVDSDTGAPLPVIAGQDTPHSFDIADSQSVLNQPSTAGYGSAQPTFASDPAPTTPFGSDQSSSFSTMPPDPIQSPTPTQNSFVDPTVTYPPNPSSDTPAVTAQQASQPVPLQAFSDYAAGTQGQVSSFPVSTADDLLDIKQQALSQLGPLVSHLDQDPEEKFRTTMMLIQSTDNPAFLHDAYTAAQAITDEGIRAQALLDVVNEINYFTQQQDQVSDNDSQAA